MDQLNGLLAFVRAAETLSFVAAGERLGVSASAIGKSVARLEEKLGVRLLNRSTRRISLTEEGALFFERCQRIVGEIADAEAELSRLTEVPRGRLRVSLPAAGHHLISPVLPAFTQCYPQVELDLDFNDRLIDIVAEGMDAVIRSGDFKDSRLRTRRLGSFAFVLVAAPGYLAERRPPEHPTDLQHHRCLRYRFPGTGTLQEWNLSAGESVARPLNLGSAFTFNSVEALIDAARNGLGIAYLPDFAVRDALSKGSLSIVLPQYARPDGQFSILWPNNRHLLPKLRVFVDFLAEHIELGR